MLQAETPEHARGRVFAPMDVLWQGGRLVSLAVGGLLADRYGIQVVYCLGGLLLIAAAAAGFLAGATWGGGPGRTTPGGPVHRAGGRSVRHCVGRLPADLRGWLPVRHCRHAQSAGRTGIRLPRRRCDVRLGCWGTRPPWPRPLSRL
jgi:hypothetical protein